MLADIGPLCSTRSAVQNRHNPPLAAYRGRGWDSLERESRSTDDPGGSRARDELIELCLPAAQRLARRFGRAGEPPDDVAQVGALGLIKAVDGFDATRGVEFGTYATPTILGEIKRYLRDRSAGVRVPRRLQELRLSVNAARDELTRLLYQTFASQKTYGDKAEPRPVDQRPA